ncbi:Fc receptor, IgE, high affinity I, gamma polypeptide like isoform X2 [Myripristis murdjan]|uniref:Fc receptor, IgE, high affinity I, gamma polypeptide like isoform X2 n=1 Tax=Myripristis murdjan TaxID=586833 RepID=UPI001175C857|nr:high affinity immunoglobulin epsilon receptor subunit gamma-like isoform X2 [Myripristis murdjan]
MMRGSLFVLLLMINVTDALGMNDVNLCYVLDGILIFYGIILTVLYCRLRMHPFQVHHVARPEKQPYEGGIYAGLTPHSVDTYETINIQKKSIV